MSPPFDDGEALARELPALAASPGRWLRWLSQAASLALLAVVLLQLRKAMGSGLPDTLPENPVFYAALLVLYLLPPTADWVIFRRLWKLPLAGLPMLLGKRIANEALMYSGEAWFYLWARRKVGLVAAPFGAIKDVNILSALVGNLVGLLLLLACLPMLSALPLGRYAGVAVGSATAMLAVSAAILLLSRRLFTLTRAELVEVSLVHLARLLLGVGLWALMGALVLPEVSAGFWLLLSVLRLLVARLPFAPHKDLLFASLAALLLEGHGEVVAFVAMSSIAVLLLHVPVGLGFALFGLFGHETARPKAAAAPANGRA